MKISEVNSMSSSVPHANETRHKNTVDRMITQMLLRSQIIQHCLEELCLACKPCLACSVTFWEGVGGNGVDV